MAYVTLYGLTNSQDIGLPGRLVAALRLWRWRARERAALARFDDRELRDIGVNRIEALAEIRKPLWRA